MTNPIPAKLAYLTNPEPRRFILNIGLRDGELRQYEINADQLRNLAANGTMMVLDTRAAQ